MVMELANTAEIQATEAMTALLIKVKTMKIYKIILVNERAVGCWKRRRELSMQKPNLRKDLSLRPSKKASQPTSQPATPQKPNIL